MVHGEKFLCRSIKKCGSNSFEDDLIQQMKHISSYLTDQSNVTTEQVELDDEITQTALDSKTRNDLVVMCEKRFLNNKSFYNRKTKQELVQLLMSETQVSPTIKLQRECVTKVFQSSYMKPQKKTGHAAKIGIQNEPKLMSMLSKEGMIKM